MLLSLIKFVLRKGSACFDLPEYKMSAICLVRLFRKKLQNYK